MVTNDDEWRWGDHTCDEFSEAPAADIDLTKYQFIPRTRSAEINPRPARPMLSLYHLLFYDCR